MSTQPMPACEALAADPARYMLKAYLGDLMKASLYEEKSHLATRMYGYLSGLLECEAIEREQYRAMTQEIQDFVWGAAQ